MVKLLHLVQWAGCGPAQSPLTSGYTPYPSFLPKFPFRQGLHIGLSVVRGKSRPGRPGWYDMVWLDTGCVGRNSDMLLKNQVTG